LVTSTLILDDATPTLVKWRNPYTWC